MGALYSVRSYRVLKSYLFYNLKLPALWPWRLAPQPTTWGRTISALGHDVRLIPLAYVKPFVKRQKNDVADAEAIAEAASRPSMRFVAVKSEHQQAGAMVFRTRDLFVRQRTQLINALRAHLAEQGIVVGAKEARYGLFLRTGRLCLNPLPEIS